MSEYNRRDIAIEILRVGIISIRNISSIDRRNRALESKLKEWAELCHSLPQVLLGGCDERAVKYFLEGDASIFAKNYPGKEDADFLQIQLLIKELSDSVN